MRYAIVENGHVANIVQSETALRSNWHRADETVYIGQAFDADSGKFVAESAPEQPEPPVLTEVTITELSGAGLVKHKRDFSLVTVTQGQNVVLKGELAIDDRTFTMPIRRSKGGYELFQVVVKNGKFSATLNFAESDIYHVSSSELNMDLPQPMFNLPVNVQIDVLRDIGDE